MNRVINTFRLEFYTARSILPLLTVGVVIGCLLGIVRRPEVTVLPIMVIGMFAGGTIFQIHERNHSGKLFGTLPVKRSDVVLGRYMYGLMMALISLTIGVILVLIFSATTGASATPPVTAFYIVSGLVGGWLFYWFAVSVSYPLFIRLEFSKAYMFTMVPYMILIIVSVYLIFKVHLAPLMKAFDYLQNHVVMWAVIGFGGGLVMMAISCAISLALYKTKELS